MFLVDSVINADVRITEADLISDFAPLRGGLNGRRNLGRRKQNIEHEVVRS